MHMEALITVAICTYNRHEHVKKLLPLLLSDQTLSEDLYQIIVVDNSDDREAREAFRGISRAIPICRSSNHPPGLSRARNVALEACATRYIAYSTMTRLRSRNGSVPSCARSQRMIPPSWPGRLSDLAARSAGMAAPQIRRLPHDSRSRSQRSLAVGARIRLRHQHGFQGRRASRGRRIQRRSRTRGAHSLLSEEEVEAQLALRQRGHRTFYAAAAGVDHAVHPNRLTRNYFRARMAWQAVSALLRDPPLLHSDWSQREIRRRLTSWACAN